MGKCVIKYYYKFHYNIFYLAGIHSFKYFWTEPIYIYMYNKYINRGFF